MNFLTDSLNMSCTSERVHLFSFSLRIIRLHLFRSENGASANVVHSLALHVGRPENLLGSILGKGGMNKLKSLEFGNME